MEQPIKPKRRYRYTVRPSPRVEKIDAKTFPSKFEGERKSGSKINFLREKGTSNRELDRFLVTRLYRATRELDLRACSGQLGCRKKGFSKRCAVSLERDACGVAVVAHARACGRRGVGRARMGREGDMPQQPWKEGWHPESE